MASLVTTTVAGTLTATSTTQPMVKSAYNATHYLGIGHSYVDMVDATYDNDLELRINGAAKLAIDKSSGAATFGGTIKGTGYGIQLDASAPVLEFHDTGETASNGAGKFRLQSDADLLYMQGRADNDSAWSNNFTMTRAGTFSFSGDTTFGGDGLFHNNARVSIATVQSSLNTPGMLTIEGPSTGNTVLSSNQWGIMIGPTHNRTTTGSVYYPGIAFNMLLNYNAGTAYDNAPQAWIGIRKYDTPGSERASIVFATKEGTGTTASDVPIERMMIDPFGKVGIGTTNPGYLLHLKAAAADISVISTTGTNRAGFQSGNTGGYSYFYKESSGGGGAFAGTSAYSTIVGGTGAYPLHLGTNSLVRMTITSTGNVGIGTNAPNFAAASGNTVKGLNIQNVGNDTQASIRLTGHNNTGGTPGQPTYTELLHAGANLRFDINHNGTVRFSIGSGGAITFNSAFTFPTAIGTSGQMLKVPSSGTILEWTSAGTGTVTGTGTDNYIPKWNGTTALENSSIHEAGAGSLQIEGPTAGRFLTLNAPTDGGYITFETADTAFADIGTAKAISGNAAYSTTDLMINTRSGAKNIVFGMNGVEKVRIDNSGKVGIGTTSPGSNLDVIADATSAGLRVRHSNLSQGIYVGYSVITGAGSNTNQDITINAKGTGDLLLNSTDGGKVGIETTVPHAPLDVAATGTYDVPTIQAGYASSATRDNYRFGIYTTSEGGYISNKNGNDGIRLVHRGNTVLTAGTGGTSATPYVGIGEVAPSSLLQLKSGGALMSGSITVVDSGGNQARFYAGLDGNEHGYLSLLQNDGTTAGLYLTGNSAGTNWILGEVGIGTNDPDQLLHVHKASGDAAAKISCSGHARLILATTGTTDHASVDFGDSGGDTRGRILYLNNGDAMKFETNGAERMRILSDGKVGLGGRTAPSTTLVIQGIFDGSATPSVSAPSDNAANKGIEIIREANDNSWGIGYTYGIDFAATSAVNSTNQYKVAAIYGAVESVPYYVAGKLGFYTTAGTNGALLTERLTIKGSGKVGIGTTGPATPLHVWSTSYPQFRVSYNSSLYFTLDHAATLNVYGNDWYVRLNSSEKFRIKQDGDVGIGTNNPLSLLHLRQAAGANIRFENATTGRWFMVGEGVGTNDKFSFRGNSYRSTDSLTVDFANNRVGVNNISPSKTLDVHGDIWLGATGTNLFGSYGDLHIYADNAKVEEYWTSGSDYMFKSYHDDIRYPDLGTKGMSIGSAVAPRAILDITGNNSTGMFNAGLGTRTISGTQSFALAPVGTVTVSGNESGMIGSCSSVTISGHRTLVMGLNNTLAIGTVSASNILSIMGGSVGIGTTNPATALDVYGHLNLRDGYNLTWGGAYGANIPSIIGVSGGSSYIVIYPAGSTSGEKLRITNDGKVGIWSTAPGGYLSVEGTGNHRGIFVAATGATTYSAIQAEANALTTGSIARFSSNSATTNTRYLVNVINDNALATGAVGLRIQQDSTAPALIALGNVGIGEVAPSSLLQLKSDGTLMGGSMTVMNSGGNQARFYGGLDANEHGYLSLVENDGSYGGTLPNGKQRWYQLDIGQSRHRDCYAIHFPLGGSGKVCELNGFKGAAFSRNIAEALR